jgi:hypothetical protein
MELDMNQPIDLSKVNKQPAADIDELADRLRENENERKLYLIRLDIMKKFLHDHQDQPDKFISAEDVKIKIFEALKLTLKFSYDDFPELFKKVKEIRELAEKVGIVPLILIHEN